jgi:type IV pilus assembly protein PilV
MTTINHIKQKQTGFSLIEVMVTIVVLSTGLLGIAALQMQSKHSNLIAAQRTLASHMVHDLLERMRANPKQLNIYTPSDTDLVLLDSISNIPSQACTSNAACDSTQLATHDIWQWSNALNGGLNLIGNDSVGSLLDAVACIGRPAGGGSGNYTVAVAWRSTKAVNNPVISENTTANNCGTTTGRYDQDNTGDNKLRHVYYIDSYIYTG